jgi:hypothetical protein
MSPHFLNRRVSHRKGPIGWPSCLLRASTLRCTLVGLKANRDSTDRHQGRMSRETRVSILGFVLLLSVVMPAASAHGQGRLSDDTSDRTHSPRVPGTPRVPDSSRAREFTPDSHVPSRSPDLGSAFFPLSPSIGPGSGSLGPEAGPDASRRRSIERDTERARNDRRAR